MERRMRLGDALGDVVNILANKPDILTRDHARELAAIFVAEASYTGDLDEIADRYAATHPVEWVRKRE